MFQSTVLHPPSSSKSALTSERISSGIVLKYCSLAPLATFFFPFEAAAFFCFFLGFSVQPDESVSFPPSSSAPPSLPATARGS